MSKFGLTSESYLFDKLPKGFDPMNKQYDPLDITKHAELVHRKENDALLVQFIQYLVLNKLGYYASAQSTSLTVTHIGGGTFTFYNMQNPLRMDSGLGTSQNWGTVVGTGNAAVTLTDYKLQTQIAAGTGAGQLVHGTQQYSSGPFTSGSSNYFFLGRSFTNLSGGAITVNEMGLYGFYTGPYYICLARDLITGGVTINDGKVGYFQYKFQITV